MKTPKSERDFYGPDLPDEIAGMANTDASRQKVKDELLRETMDDLRTLRKDAARYFDRTRLNADDALSLDLIALSGAAYQVCDAALSRYAELYPNGERGR